jgi:DNA-binding transcriptional LysR family regulator
LSEVGERLFPRVKALLSDAEQLDKEIRGEAREPAGRVTLGFLPSIAQPLVGRLYSEMRSRHPAVSLKVLEGSSGQVEEWLADARVDIAILYRYGPTLPETEQSLAVVDSYLVGPPGDSRTADAEVQFTSLDELPFILPSAPNGLRTALDAMARQHHITLAPAVEADSLRLQKSLVAKERLYTVLPLHAVWVEVADARLQSARIIDPPLQRTVSMAFSKSKGPARAQSPRWRRRSSRSSTTWHAPACGGRAPWRDRGGIADMRLVTQVHAWRTAKLRHGPGDIDAAHHAARPRDHGRRPAPRARQDHRRPPRQDPGTAACSLVQRRTRRSLAGPG